jgi:ketosteroid isomerase-like protein
MELCHPEIEWIAPEDGATHRGRAGVRQRLEEWLESFDDCRWEVQRMIDFGGGEVLVEATEMGRGAKSGAEVRTTEYELLTIRHGMIVRIREFYDEARGPRSRRAVGVGDVAGARGAGAANSALGRCAGTGFSRGPSAVWTGSVPVHSNSANPVEAPANPVAGLEEPGVDRPEPGLGRREPGS